MASSNSQMNLPKQSSPQVISQLLSEMSSLRKVLMPDVTSVTTVHSEIGAYHRCWVQYYCTLVSPPNAQSVKYDALGPCKSRIRVTRIAEHTIVNHALGFRNTITPERLSLNREIAYNSTLGPVKRQGNWTTIAVGFRVCREVFPPSLREFLNYFRTTRSGPKLT